MATLLERYSSYSRRRRRVAAKAHQRLDIQGLRAVAVLSVFANHLWSVPAGGFIGVDVFFVISGFLITGNLLRMAETKGNVSFRQFYWNRVRRIVPAATIVLVATCLISFVIYMPFRAREVGIDSFFAFIFLSNWWFAYEGTDYFRATAEAISPIQHYWSLSIEEQFYFVWPALLFFIGLAAGRKAWSHQRRTYIAGLFMFVIVVASISYAVFVTSGSPNWAYFDTFARVWELGIGAMLACVGSKLSTSSAPVVRSIVSWGGLALIGASVMIVNETSVGFPAPWALLPTLGAALVVAAGIGSEPRWQGLLRNPVSGYIGDISYSLYLVHWPAIVLLGSIMEKNWYFYTAAIATSFAAAIFSYHFIENPLRRIDGATFREALYQVRRRRVQPERSSAYALLGSLILVAVALVSFITRPGMFEVGVPRPVSAEASADLDQTASTNVPPLTARLQDEIESALTATEWPPLDPSMESVLSGPQVPPDLEDCGRGAVADDDRCSWGDALAPVQMVLVGDSVALGYAEPLRLIALNSGGRVRVHSEAMLACAFSDALINRESLSPDCPARKQHAIDYINKIKPDLVVVSNSYGPNQIVGTSSAMSPADWFDSMKAILENIQPADTKVVFLAPPPRDVDINECYGTRSSSPVDCVGKVDQQWSDTARSEQGLAQVLKGNWIDSRQWFCSTARRLCPSFVGSTPTKHDEAHIANAYGIKIHPVIAEALQAAGVI